MSDWEVSGHLNASPGVVGGMRTPRQRLEGSAFAASAGVASQPIGWAVSSSYVHSQGVAPIPDAIATHAAAITPSDATVFSPAYRWLWIGGVGDVSLVMADGTNILLSAVPAGTRLPFSVKQVLSTGTSATSIVGVY